MLTLAALLLALPAAAQPEPPKPAHVVVSGTTRTLADVARERRLGKVGVVGGTVSVAGAPIDPMTAALAARTKADDDKAIAEAAYLMREAAAARQGLKDVEAATPNVVSFGRPGWAHGIMMQQRDNTLAPARANAAAAERAAEAARQDLRSRGLPVNVDRVDAQPAPVRTPTTESIIPATR
jgi:hypothetical protein